MQLQGFSTSTEASLMHNFSMFSNCLLFQESDQQFNRGWRCCLVEASGGGLRSNFFGAWECRQNTQGSFRFRRSGHWRAKLGGRVEWVCICANDVFIHTAQMLLNCCHGFAEASVKPRVRRMCVSISLFDGVAAEFERRCPQGCQALLNRQQMCPPHGVLVWFG